jgi:hypothetical protein
VSRTRRFLLLAVALAGVLGLTSCSEDTGGTAAITVNDQSISINEFSNELRTLGQAENLLVLQSYEQQASQLGFPVSSTTTTVPTDPATTETTEPEDSEDVVSSGAAASLATSRITFMLVQQELDERDIEVTPEQVDVARAEASAPPTDPSTGQPTGEESPFNGFSEEFQQQYAEDQAAVAALREAVEAEGAEAEVAEPTDEEVEAALAAATEQTCASIILVATQADADAALARVEAGEDFATVAGEVSLDQSSTTGGDIGCFGEGELGVPDLETAFAAAAEGDVVGPVSLQVAGADGVTPVDQFVVAQVTSKGLPTEEQIREDLAAAAAQEAAQEDPLTPVIEEAFADADIRVASRYGTWDAELRSVVPPEGPAQATTSTTVPAGIDPATGLPAEEAPAAGG